MPPIDNKRITGPESSQTPQKFVAKITKPQAILNKKGKRQDGRLATDNRPIFLKVGVISQASGSSYIELGKTKVICAVYGPREIAKRLDFRINGQISCEFKYAPFACQLRRQYQQDNEERELSQILKEALEPAVCLFKFPKAQVDVYVTVLDNDGGAFSSAITAAGAALANAGIPMYDLLIGCSLHCYNDSLLLDPTNLEENEHMVKSKPSTSIVGHGNVVVGMLSSFQQVTCLVHDGAIEKHVLIQAVKALIDNLYQLNPVIQKVLLSSWKQEEKNRTTAK